LHDHDGRLQWNKLAVNGAAKDYTFGLCHASVCVRALDRHGIELGSSGELGGRNLDAIRLPSVSDGVPLVVRLHVDHGGARVAGDDRVLNFRVFRMWMDELPAWCQPRFARRRWIRAVAGPQSA
jgi:hypothetical protein